MVATFSIPDLQSIIHAVLPRNSGAMCDKREERLVSIVYLVCLVGLVEPDGPDRPNEPDEPSPVVPLSHKSGEGDCGPKLHDDPQDRCNGEQQKHDSPGDDAGYIDPSLLRFSVRLSRSSPQ